MQLSFVASSPMGTIVTDPRDNQKYVLVPYQFAQQMFRNSKYLMDFEADNVKLSPKQKETLEKIKKSAGQPGGAYVEVDNRGWKPYRTRPVQGLLDKGMIKIIARTDKYPLDYPRIYDRYAYHVVLTESFEAEYRVQELLPAEEFVSLDAVSTKADLPHKVFIGVRGEGEDQVSYILQEESLDDEPVYRILYVMEEVDMDELETFNAVVIGRKPKGYAATAVMYQKMLEQAELQETLLHLESAVRLGLITEEEIMQKMIQKFGAEDRDESERMTRAEAEALANKVSDMLEPYADFVEVCGSYRRGREDPGDLDVVVILKEGITLPEIVAELEGNYEKYNWLGEKKTQLVIDGVKVDIKVSTPTGIGAALLYFTGPSGYNIGMRSAAKRKGFKLNEYGLFDRDTNEYLGGATEEEIYDLLGRTYKPPEMRAEEGSAPIQRPMEFGEPVNWTPLDGTPSLKRRRDAESSVSSDADLFWLWLCDEDLVFHRLLARMYRSKNFGFLREPGQRNPETFDFSYYGYNEGHLEYLLDNSLLSLEEQNEEALENISFQLAQKMMNWVEMASNDIGMPDWTSEEMVVAVDLGNTYAEDMVYLIFPDGSEMQMETFNVVKGYPMYDETYSREIIPPQRTKQIGGVKVPIARIPMDESSDSMQFIWSGELKVVAINDREPYSFKDGQV